jgi:hypothetical protein
LRDPSRNISLIRGYQLATYKNAYADALKSELTTKEAKILLYKIEQRQIY